MRKNTLQVIEAFLLHQSKGNRSDSISTDGTTIYSYDTPIACHTAGVICLTFDRFSKTTTRQQNTIRAMIPDLWEILELPKISQK